MVKLNRNYSDYTDETDVNYPEGKAVNASGSESYNGTPLLAEFMNDINAAHIAMYEKAYGNRKGITGEADTQKKSQFADAVVKYVGDKDKAHADKRGLSDGVHGATADVGVGQIMCRDEYGRSKVSAPVDDTDIANKRWVLEAVYPVGSLYWSSKSTNPNSLFGGTWKQIKDCFIWAKGDSDTVDATGGSKTRTLVVANLPSHNHPFTGSEHSHTYTPAGTISGGAYTFTGSEVATTSQSSSDTGLMSGAGSASWKVMNEASADLGNRVTYSSVNPNGAKTCSDNDAACGTLTLNLSHTHSFSHTHKLTAKGSISITTNPTFKGTQATLKATAGGTVGNTGSGTAVNIMPPYVVKYCWERTA